MSSEDQMDHDNLDDAYEVNATGEQQLAAASSDDDDDEEMESGAEIDNDEDDDEEDDDDDDDEDDEELKLMKTYMEVLQRVSENKYNYDDYVLLVNTAQ